MSAIKMQHIESTAEYKINKLEDIFIETIQNEIQRDKRLERKKMYKVSLN